MQSVEQIAKEIVASEGGFVNDKDDPGGATKNGVTIGTLRGLRLDLTGDGIVDIADVRALTQEDAVRIFIKHYFYKPRINLLPEALQPSVFDMQVNAGSNAVRILQHLLAQFVLPVTVDGVIGPKTAESAKQAYAHAGEYLVDAYGIARRDYYFRLADRRPAMRKFAMTRAGGKGGWIKRAEDFMRPQYRLTDAQFRARVADWQAQATEERNAA